MAACSLKAWQLGWGCEAIVFNPRQRTNSLAERKDEGYDYNRLAGWLCARNYNGSFMAQMTASFINEPSTSRVLLGLPIVSPAHTKKEEGKKKHKKEKSKQLIRALVIRSIVFVP